MLVKGGSRSVDGMESYYDVSVLQTTAAFFVSPKLNITHGLVVVIVGCWLIKGGRQFRLQRERSQAGINRAQTCQLKDSSRAEMQPVTPHVLLARNTKRKGGLREIYTEA